jgi:hypothetical protein
MGVKKGQKRGPNPQPYVIECIMCGQPRRCADPRAETCGSRCRMALSRWVAHFGSRPSKPPKRTAAGYSLMTNPNPKRPRKGPVGR